ncbi:MAG: acyl carrier protein [Solobacterium sp.]|nr:acyl carrier protein [Solobacterium sp.]
MEERIKQLLAETIEDSSNIASWNSDTDIINEIGLDSLQMVRFLLKLEDELGIQIDYDNLDFDDLKSIGSLAAFIKRCAKKMPNSDGQG